MTKEEHDILIERAKETLPHMLTVVTINHESSLALQEEDQYDKAKEVWESSCDYAQDWVDAKLLEQRERIAETCEGMKVKGVCQCQQSDLCGCREDDRNAALDAVIEKLAKKI